MSGDLRTLLKDAAPRPRQPIDVDEVFTRVHRRRTGRRAAAGAAAVVFAVAALVGVAQLFPELPSLPIIGQAGSAVDSCSASDLGREPNEPVQVVDDVDLDGDGADDRVTLHRDGLILACLADGRAMGALAASVGTTRRHAFDQTLGRVDLGGIAGVSVTISPHDPGWADLVFLLRVYDNELGIVGDPNVGAGRPPGPPRHIDEAQEFFTGPAGPPAWETESYNAFGCRPAPEQNVDFWVAQLILWSSGRLDLDIWGGVDGLTIGAPRSLPRPDLPDAPDDPADMDLDQVLRDLGFTPRCLPEE